MSYNSIHAVNVLTANSLINVELVSCGHLSHVVHRCLFVLMYSEKWCFRPRCMLCVEAVYCYRCRT